MLKYNDVPSLNHPNWWHVKISSFCGFPLCINAFFLFHPFILFYYILHFSRSRIKYYLFTIKRKFSHHKKVGIDNCLDFSRSFSFYSKIKLFFSFFSTKNSMLSSKTLRLVNWLLHSQFFILVFLAIIYQICETIYLFV